MYPVCATNPGSERFLCEWFELYGDVEDVTTFDPAYVDRDRVDADVQQVAASLVRA